MIPSRLFYSCSPSKRESILTDGIRVDADGPGIALTSEAPPTSPLLDIYTVDASDLEIRVNSQVDEALFHCPVDVPVRKLVALNDQELQHSAPGLAKLLEAAAKAQDEFTAFVDEVRSGVDAGFEPDAQRFFSLSEAHASAQSALCVALADVADEDFGFHAYTSDGRLLTLTPSAQQPGKYQLTRFGTDGAPFGDTQFPTKLQAARVLVEECDLRTVSGFALELDAKASTKDVPAPSLDRATRSIPSPPRSAEFLKWFGDSKAVDAKGKPLVLFHGTQADIHEFEMCGNGKTSDTGAFFTSSADVAQTYAGEHGCVMPVYLSLQNPVVIDCKGKNWNALDLKVKVRLPLTPVSESTDSRLIDLLQRRTSGSRLIDMLQRRTSGKRTGDMLPSAILTLDDLFPGELKYDDASTDDLARWARANGYESIVFLNVRDRGPSGKFGNDLAKEPSNVYVAFRPEQIKSVLGSGLHFDGQSPSIISKSEAQLQSEIDHFCARALNPDEDADREADMRENLRKQAVLEHIAPMTAAQQCAYFAHALSSHLGLPPQLAAEHVDELLSGYELEDAIAQLIDDLGPHWHTPNLASTELAAQAQPRVDPEQDRAAAQLELVL